MIECMILQGPSTVGGALFFSENKNKKTKNNFFFLIKKILCKKRDTFTHGEWIFFSKKLDILENVCVCVCDCVIMWCVCEERE